MAAASEIDNVNKEHISVCIAGAVDSGKSTTTGHLLFQLGGIPERELEKMKQTAHEMGKDSFHFAFFLDTQKAERERGITISCTVKEFFTDNYHYTIIDAPGHVDFIKNFLSGSSQADIGVLLIPADSNFESSIQKGEGSEFNGQSRQHALLYQLIGIKQLIIGINKMDEKSVNYSQSRFDEVATEARNMLVSVGWPKDFVANNVPIIPIAGLAGDNLFKPSENMPWFTGSSAKNSEGKVINVQTLYGALNDFVTKPKRSPDAPLRMPVSGVLNIKGVGDVITGRVEQGTLRKDDVVSFIPTHTSASACTGKVFSMEMHHTTLASAKPGDNVGVNIKGLENKPKPGDIMILSKDALRPAKRVVIQAQIVNHPGEIKIGYSPIGYVRTRHAAFRITKINWRVGKETGKQKVEDPLYVKQGDGCEFVCEPQQSVVVEEFAKCQGLGRVAFIDGSRIVAIGKVISVEY